jgi:hypothetical protein
VQHLKEALAEAEADRPAFTPATPPPAAAATHKQPGSGLFGKMKSTFSSKNRSPAGSETTSPVGTPRGGHTPSPAGAGYGTGSVIDTAKQAAAAAVQKTQDAATVAKETAQDYLPESLGGNTQPSPAGEAATRVRNNVAGTTEKARDNAAYTADQTKQAASSAVNTTADYAYSAADSTKQTTSATVQKVGDTAAYVGDQTKQAANTTADYASSAVDSAKQTASAAAQKTTDTAAYAADQTKQAASNVVNTTAQYASSAADSAKQTAAAAAQTAGDTAAYVSDKTKASAAAAYDTAAPYAAAAADSAKQTAAVAANKAGEVASVVADKTKETAATTAQAVVDRLPEGMGGTPHDAPKSEAAKQVIQHYTNGLLRQPCGCCKSILPPNLQIRQVDLSTRKLSVCCTATVCDVCDALLPRAPCPVQGVLVRSCMVVWLRSKSAIPYHMSK